MEEVISVMSNKVLFSVLDQRQGFYQIKLDSKSSDYCCFITRFGKYKFLRLLLLFLLPALQLGVSFGLLNN